MIEDYWLPVLREYVVLSLTYSLTAAVLVELLLKLWYIRSPGTRFNLRLMVLLFPPPLAFLYPLARTIYPITPRWQLLDTHAIIRAFDLYLPTFGYFLILLQVATAAHFVIQVILPAIRRRLSVIATDIPSDPKLMRVYSAAAAKMGTTARLIESSNAEPAAEVRGVFSPSVVVSSALVRLLDEEELEGVLAHELAHVRHAHIALNWLSTALRILMFFNPLAALYHTVIALDAERDCDDAAIAAIKRPLAFATALIKVHRACARPVPRRFSTGASTPLVVRIAAWENHALQSFTVERVKRVINVEPSEDGALAHARQALAGVALAALLLFVA